MSKGQEPRESHSPWSNNRNCHFISFALTVIVCSTGIYPLLFLIRGMMHCLRCLQQSAQAVAGLP